MNRIAILIGSPLSDNHPNHLSGVEYDVRNFYNFLLSSTGGAWSKEEIVYRKNPTIQQFKEIKQQYAGADFAFVYFSGHGFYSPIINDQVLEINDREKLKSTAFLNFSQRQITLFDACRVFSDWLGFSGVIEKPDLIYDFKNQENARKEYLSQILNVNSGQAILFSTQKGNVSSEDPSNGGFFSSSILLAASKFYQNPQDTKILDVYSAFVGANEIIKSVYTTDQQPKIKADASAYLLPFAVKPYNQIQKQYTNYQIQQKQAIFDDTDKWVLTGLGILGAILLGKAIFGKK